MNIPQLSNTPPVVDFLATPEKSQNPTCVRLEAFLEDARQRLAGMPYGVRLKAVKQLIRALRGQKPSPLSLDVWWSDIDRHPQAFYRLPRAGYDFPPPHPAFTGFTGIATVNGVPDDKPKEEGPVSHHEKWQRNDWASVGENEATQ